MYAFILLSVIFTGELSAQAVVIDSVSITSPACGAADGSILVHASGGTTQLIYSNDNNTTTQADSLFTNLSPGVYVVVVSDSVGFIDSINVILYGYGGLSIDAINETDVTCFGLTDGIGDIAVSGGTGSYSFELENDTIQNNGTFTNLAGGNYIVFITDGSFCRDTVSLTINEPLELDFTSVTIDANCPASDGDITINATGGDGNYMFSIDAGSNFQAGNNFPGQAAGPYTGVVMDGAGCTDTATIFVNSAPGTGPNIITLNFINPLCNGSNNGSITVFATGSQPIVYSNDGGISFQTGNTFTGLAPGTYDMVVEDAAGCPVGSSLTIVEPAVLMSGIIGIDETCVAGNGSITFNTTGGTGAYSYSIDSGLVFNNNASFTGLSGGTYHYVVMDNNGCTDTGTVVLQAGGGPTILSIDIIQPTCPLDSDGSIVINAVSQNGPIQYSIDGGSVLFPTDSFPNLPVGVYNIILVDGDGCVTSQQVTLSGPGTPLAGFSADVTSGFIPLVVNFTDNSFGSTGYNWDFGDNNSSTIQDPSNTFTSAGFYTVIQTVTDGTCTDTASIIIEVIGDPSVTVPNVFTPNGDGLNDVFAPQVVGIAELHGQIFNRYGALVYEWFGPEGWWDGYTAPAGVHVAEGTYFYVITAVGVEGSQFEEKGIVTLLRQVPFKR